MKHLFEDRHLTNAALQALFEDRLDHDQILAAADHIAGCTHCAQRLADCAAQHIAIPPRGFTELTLQRIQDEPHQKKRVFYVYCARIAACAALIIGISFSGVVPSLEWRTSPTPAKQGSLPTRIEAREPDASQKFFQNIGNLFIEFKDSILNTEENTNDQTKK